MAIEVDIVFKFCFRLLDGDAPVDVLLLPLLLVVLEYVLAGAASCWSTFAFKTAAAAAGTCFCESIILCEGIRVTEFTFLLSMASIRPASERNDDVDDWKSENVQVCRLQ